MFGKGLDLFISVTLNQFILLLSSSFINVKNKLFVWAKVFWHVS